VVPSTLCPTVTANEYFQYCDCGEKIIQWQKNLRTEIHDVARTKQAWKEVKRSLKMLCNPDTVQNRGENGKSTTEWKESILQGSDTIAAENQPVDGVVEAVQVNLTIGFDLKEVSLNLLV
jgi:hypothetical protein